ncbi:FAD-dependent oxidoreductase [Acinetobacter ihumii]|uniref:FAD-dependent oxidoreductase n=1 Tax=Acinetobacter ihumii TaxID=2483802 RepID=UPI00102F534D|nr:FAD-dependent oxidoreductase [Acinetobacter ihumii]
MTHQVDRILVVGAGIAGCSAAIAFSQMGKKVTILEKAKEIQFNSSGIFIYSNGLAHFKKLGVLSALIANGFEIEQDENQYFTHTGETIVNTHYPRMQPDIPGILGIKRAELHRVLVERMQELGIEFEMGTTLETLHEIDSIQPIQVEYSNGKTATFDLIVGADGVRSHIRNFINPEIEPTYTGFCVWRSVHQRPKHVTKKIMQMGVGKRVGILPISHDKMYMFGTVVDTDKVWKPKEQWHQYMRHEFSDFTGGEVARLLEELNPATDILYTAVEEIHMPPPWNKGRTIIIGDAAHASTPFMGQGGTMAVQDAVELSEMLQHFENNPDADTQLEQKLQEFSEKRYAMCKFVQDVSRSVGQSGATESLQDCQIRNANMLKYSQSKVDEFYGKLSEFS